MDWSTSQTWVTAINSANYLGFNDWRLPTTLQPDASCSSVVRGTAYYDCSGSELGHLFYSELGSVADQHLYATHNVNFLLFNNIQDYVYGSGTETDSTGAWSFNTMDGVQSRVSKIDFLPVWAVRTGDVSSIPEPGIIWLFGADALAWSGTRARRRG